MNRVIRTPDGRPARLRPVRLYRLNHLKHPRAAEPFPSGQTAPPQAANEPTAGQAERQPIPSGQAYRMASPPEQSLVTAQLADELSKALEQFAQTNGFNAEKPLSVSFGRGTLGLHRFGRAADIYAVGSKGIGQWAHEWNAAMRQAAAAPNPQERARLVAEEQGRNLGFKLYKALLAHGGWAQPPKYPVQLFGPWTRGEGPHRAISDRLLNAHRDHIHVAK